ADGAAVAVVAGAEVEAAGADADAAGAAADPDVAGDGVSPVVCFAVVADDNCVCLAGGASSGCGSRSSSVAAAASGKRKRIAFLTVDVSFQDFAIRSFSPTTSALPTTGVAARGDSGGAAAAT